MSKTVLITPGHTISGATSVPGDKSISHRALIFGALAHGETAISNIAPGQDVRSTANVLRALGVKISDDDRGSMRVVGRGFDGLHAPEHPLDCGNSGTTMRLMMGLLAGRPFSSQLVGDASLSKRPMGRIATPLKAMGASFELGDAGRPPVTIHGGPLTAIKYQSPVASAQVKTAVLLAGLQAEGTTIFSEDVLSRDHSERMLSAMNAPLTSADTNLHIKTGPLTALGEYPVPGDLSSAAFLMAAALMLDGAGVRINGVGLNASRTGFLDAIESMGAKVEIVEKDGLGERVGDLTIGRSPLKPLRLGGSTLVRAIDEVPILAVLATQASGRSIISDAGELRVKESDRLAATSQFLNDMGANVEETADGLIIDGPTALNPTQVETHHDHRIAMAAAVAGLSCGVTIHGAECADISYPSFYDVLAELSDAKIEHIE